MVYSGAVRFVKHCMVYSGAATICGTLHGVQQRRYDLWNTAWCTVAQLSVEHYMVYSGAAICGTHMVYSGAATICVTLHGVQWRSYDLWNTTCWTVAQLGSVEQCMVCSGAAICGTAHGVQWRSYLWNSAWCAVAQLSVEQCMVCSGAAICGTVHGVQWCSYLWNTTWCSYNLCNTAWCTVAQL